MEVKRSCTKVAIAENDSRSDAIVSAFSSGQLSKTVYPVRL
jgi:hypothetical protein